MSVKRGLDVRDFMLTTFGGSGSLLACRLVDILDLAGVVVPQNPGNVSAFGLLTVDVKNDYVQTHVARHDALDHDAVETVFDALTARATDGLDTEGFPREQHDHVRTVDLRYFGQAYEVRVPAGRARSTPGRRPRWPSASTTSTASSTATTSATTRASRSSGSTCGSPASARSPGPSCRELALPRDGDGAPRRVRAATVCFDADAGYVATDVYWRPDLRAGDTFAGPAVVEEFGSTVPVHPGFAVRVDAFGNLVVTKEAQ